MYIRDELADGSGLSVLLIFGKRFFARQRGWIRASSIARPVDDIDSVVEWVGDLKLSLVHLCKHALASHHSPEPKPRDDVGTPVVTSGLTHT